VLGATLWKCEFPTDDPKEHTYIERQTDLMEKNIVALDADMKTTRVEVLYPHFTRTKYSTFAARAWPVLNDRPKSSLAGATILIVDLRTNEATLTQIVTSVEAGGIYRGTCRSSASQ
jgi:hypothetical protein